MFRFLPPVFEDVFFGVEILFSISLLGESIIQLGSSIHFNDHPMNIR